MIEQSTAEKKKALINIGKLLSEAIPFTDSEETIFMKSTAIADHMGMGGFYRTAPYEQIVTPWMTHWGHSAFPIYQLSHTYAASLLSTSLGKVPEDIETPFKAFLLEVPPGILSTTDRDGTEIDVRLISVMKVLAPHANEKSWMWAAHTESTIGLWEHANKEMMFKDERLNQDASLMDPFRMDLTDRDARVCSLIRRLILNTCLAISSKDNVKPIGRSKSMTADQIRRSEEPIARVFQVGKPVRIDCRESVRDYIEGKRRTTNVQILVAGHWKRQPHGQGRELRKWIHLEPYWRGPEEAPILVRPHVMGDVDTKTSTCSDPAP